MDLPPVNPSTKGEPRTSGHGHHPSKETRGLVTLARADGRSQEEIANAMRIDLKTLRKHYKDELENGKFSLDMQMMGKVVQKALAGDGDMVKFYLRCKGGWKEGAQLELTGPDGGALQIELITSKGHQVPKPMNGNGKIIEHEA